MGKERKGFCMGREGEKKSIRIFVVRFEEVGVFVSGFVGFEKNVQRPSTGGGKERKFQSGSLHRMSMRERPQRHLGYSANRGHRVVLLMVVLRNQHVLRILPLRCSGKAVTQRPLLLWNVMRVLLLQRWRRMLLDSHGRHRSDSLLGRPHWRARL